MKAKQRSHGKAIRWSQTRSGKKHIARILWLKRSMAILNLAQTQAEIRVMAGASLKHVAPALLKGSKILSIAQAHSMVFKTQYR